MKLRKVPFVLACVSALCLSWSEVRDARAQSGTWCQIMGTGPSARTGLSACLDTQGNRMILFGGEDAGGFKSDVWALSLGSGTPQWTDITPSGLAPHPRKEHRIVYDPTGNQVILFGGEAETFHGQAEVDTVFGDTWSLSLGASPGWTQLNPTGDLPCPRAGHSAVFDGRMIIHGGEILVNGGPWYTNGTFFLTLGNSPVWDNNQGTSVCAEDPTTCVDAYRGNPGETCPGWPGARWYHAAIYDPPGARMLTHGGAYDLVDGQTWILPLPGNWSQISPTGSPDRENHRAVYDSHRRRMLLFGGDDPGNAPIYRSDVWALSLASPTAWTQLSASNPPGGPLPRSFSAVVYDPTEDRIVVFGGNNATTKFGDTWVYTFDDATPPAATSDLIIASYGSNSVTLNWTAPGDDGTGGGSATSYSIRKRSGSAITEANWASSTVVTGAPAPHAPGITESMTVGGLTSGVFWYFALKTNDDACNSSGVSNNDCIKFGNPPEWCGGPGSAVLSREEGVPARELAITAVRPNPTSEGGADISFTLADDSPARVEVLDIAGRLVEAHDLARLGPGVHEVRLGAGAKLSPGHYRVRIRQGDRTATRSAIVVH